MRHEKCPVDFTLLGRRLAAVSRSDVESVLSSALSDGATVISWSPRAVSVGQIRSGQILDHDGQRLDWSDAYEARGFSPVRDARWRATPASGVVVVISEESLDDIGGENIDVQGITGRIHDVTYCVVGEFIDRDANWVSIGAARFGSLSLPISGVGRRAVLESVEYVSIDDDGNADIVEERLVELRMMED